MRIFSITNSVWEESGIFPEVMERRADVAKIRADANAQFRKMGIGNLRLLCDQFKLLIPKNSDKSDIVDLLLENFPTDLLVHAFEFQKKKSRAIQELFASVSVRVRHVAAGGLGRRGPAAFWCTCSGSK